MNIGLQRRVCDFEHWAFSALTCDGWKYGLRFYLNRYDKTIPVCDIRHYMRKFRHVHDFDMTVHFSDTDIFSLPVQYVEYNIQNALNIGLVPHISTAGEWVATRERRVAVLEMLRQLRISRTTKRKSTHPILLVIDNKNKSISTQKIIMRYINMAGLSDIVDVCVAKPETRYCFSNGYTRDVCADIFTVAPDGGPRLFFNFHPNGTVCAENAAGVAIGQIPYKHTNDRYKSLLDIRIEMAMKMIADFKQNII